MTEIRVRTSCFGSATVSAGGAGTECGLELYNVSTSGVELHLKRIELTTAEDGGSVKFRYHTASQFTTAKTVANKLLAGPTPKATLLGDAVASVSGTLIWQPAAAAATKYSWEFYPAIIVPPGYTFVIDNPTAQKAITLVNLEWDEVIR